MVLLSNILLSNEVSITFFIELLLFLLLVVAVLNAIFILKGWNKDSSNEQQYKLEKKSYLVLSIVSLALVAKVILLPFFIYTLNELSVIIPGAMCGAGVIQTNGYGEATLVSKSVIIILILLWISLNKEDNIAKNYPYFKKKMWFFIAIFILISIELILELLYFTNISTAEPVLCCSTIYKNESGVSSLPLNLSINQLLLLFYTLFISTIISLHFKKDHLILPLSLLYGYISYYAIVYFFTPYIYQLPTHKCPFCMFQSDYNYIGYFIFISLFMASFHAINSSIFSFSKDSYKKSILFYLLSNLFISIYFVIYLLKNGVFL